MQYFLPFWPGDDIYEQFDPWKDAWKGKEKRIWECFPRPPIDGVLVSLVNIQRTNHLKRMAEKEGIHKALGFNGPVMGDCGAFSYVNQLKPPDPIQTLAYYKKLGFDIGVTVDHLIVNTIKIKKEKRKEEKRVLTDEEKQYRWQITIDNAKKMFDEAQKSDYEKMRLIGISQGLNPESYVDGIRELLDYGFDYVGLGGLAKKPTKFVQEVLFRVAKEINRHAKAKGLKNNLRPRVGFHLFGVARIDLLETMIKCGVTSFDSASPLRIAWTSSNKNYMMNKDFYAAIRVPIAKNEEERREEEKVFRKLRDYHEGKTTADEFLEELSHYDPKRLPSRRKDAKKTLEVKPWEKCDCPICDETWIHVCIFRGCERNMRRGFHNVYQFHKFLRENYPRVIALTWCTKEKDPDEKLLPAYKRYSASNLFRTFWDNLHDLPVEIGILSAKYMLINWDTRIPNYEQRLTITKLPEATKDLESKLQFYDKVFFIGLGVYRQAVEKAAGNVNVPVEVYPKLELSRGKLDIIEYNRQMKEFREAIKKEIAPYLSIELTAEINRKISEQSKLDTFQKNDAFI